MGNTEKIQTKSPQIKGLIFLLFLFQMMLNLFQGL